MGEQQNIPATMKAMVLTGHGGIDKLVYRDVPVPKPAQGEVLIKVTATGKNNTDRKVREGLYSTSNPEDVTSFNMSGKSTLTFPRIQGADVVGTIVTVGEGVSQERIGKRGLLDFNIYPDNNQKINLTPDYYGHGKDGGYAEYMVAPSEQFHTIENPELSDAELASLGCCSYQTALHMLNVADVKRGENILITGASGGVGTALIQLCRIRDAIPYVVTSQGKEGKLKDIGAEGIIIRDKTSDFAKTIDEVTGRQVIDAVMDVVGGNMTNHLFDILTYRMNERKTYPRYSIAGASGGATSQILWTMVYLNQIQVFGVSHGTRDEAEYLIKLILEGKLKPILHGTFKLSELHIAEEYFVNRHKDHVGKIVIVPDSQWNDIGSKYEVEDID